MKRFITVILLAAFCLVAKGQNVSDMIISEVLPVPDSTGIRDDFGRQTGWIELMNTSQGTVLLGGCHLTDDLSDLKKSLIPKSDSRAQVGPRQVALFFASGRGADGTFYANFEVRKGSTVYLISNDGRTVIDSLSIPADLPDGKSIAKFANDAKKMDFQPVWPSEPSPMIVNGSGEQLSNAQIMAEKDPFGIVLTVVSVSVVFVALAVLWFLFSSLFKDKKDKKAPAPKKVKAGEVSPEVALAIAMALEAEAGGDDEAAIAMALHLYLTDCIHDQESFVLTIRPSGPTQWNDKQQTFRQLPR